MNNTNVLVLGGAGFLGKRIIHFLKKENINVFYGDLSPIKGFEKSFIPINVLNKSDFEKVNQQFSTVINLTGQVTNPSFTCFQLNTKGICNIIDFVNTQKSNLIHISTLSVYGSSEIKVDEKSPLNPETVYGTLKATSEFLLQKSINSEQLAILRLSNLYGDNQPKGIMAYLLKSLKNKEELNFNNDGFMERSYLNVDDAAKAIVLISKNFSNGIYNLSGQNKYSIRELIDLIETIFLEELKVTYNNIKSWENLQGADSSKIKNTFNFTHEYSLNKWLSKQK